MIAIARDYRSALISIYEAAEYLVGNGDRPPHYETVRRYYKKGVGGVKLAVKRQGGRVVTSIAAIEEFIEARSRVDDLSEGRFEDRDSERDLIEAGVKPSSRRISGNGRKARSETGVPALQ